MSVWAEHAKLLCKTNNRVDNRIIDSALRNWWISQTVKGNYVKDSQTSQLFGEEDYGSFGKQCPEEPSVPE